MVESSIKKFEFENFSKDLVVNDHADNKNQTEELKVEAINQAVRSHIQTITDQEPKSPTTAQANVTTIAEKKEFIEPQIDINSIKKKAFDEGYAQAKKEYEEKINLLQQEHSFDNLLSQKMEQILPDESYKNDLKNFTYEILKMLAEKLYKSLPSNFEEIIKSLIKQMQDNLVKAPSITFTVNPEQIDITKEKLEIGNLPENLQGRVKVTASDKLLLNDVEVHYNSTKIVYSQENVLAEISAIIDEMKPSTQNNLSAEGSEVTETTEPTEENNNNK